MYGISWVTDPEVGERLVCSHGSCGDVWRCVDLITGEELQVNEKAWRTRRANRNSIADVGLDPALVPNMEGTSERHDPWWDYRARSPWFRAIVRVLIKHREVVYYSVDWRPFIWGKATCPAEQKDLDRAAKAGRPVRDPDPICGSMNKAYTDGGGGYLERFARRVIPREGEALSAAVRRAVREDFDRGTRASHDERFRQYYGLPEKPVITFDELLALMGFTDEVFEAFDERLEVERAKLVRELTRLGLWPRPEPQLQLFAEPVAIGDPDIDPVDPFETNEDFDSDDIRIDHDQAEEAIAA